MKKLLMSALLCLMCTTYINAQTQSELTETSAISYIEAKKQLNQVYQKLLTLCDNDEKVMLTQSQSQWEIFRDKHCDFDTYEGGPFRSSEYDMMYELCLTNLTNQRIKQLKEKLAEK